MQAVQAVQLFPDEPPYACVWRSNGDSLQCLHSLHRHSPLPRSEAGIALARSRKTRPVRPVGPAVTVQVPEATPSEPSRKCSPPPPSRKLTLAERDLVRWLVDQELEAWPWKP